jgi:hypothetical protein
MGIPDKEERKEIQKRCPLASARFCYKEECALWVRWTKDHGDCTLLVIATALMDLVNKR